MQSLYLQSFFSKVFFSGILSISALTLINKHYSFFLYSRKSCDSLSFFAIIYLMNFCFHITLEIVEKVCPAL